MSGKSFSSDVIQPNCSRRKCRHFLGVKYLEEGKVDTEVVFCAAFPEGIPDEIAYGPVLHHLPYPGDRGIQYEPPEGEEEPEVELIDTAGDDEEEDDDE